MKRAFLSFLLASVLLSFITLAGMTIFGMQGVMHMDADSCMGVSCSTDGDTGTSGTDCLNHCLSVASSVTTVVTPMPFAVVFLLAVVVLLLAEWLSNLSIYAPSVERWREGIGKLLLQQKLSTVILRD
jgi:hypothetical protein